MDWKWLSVTTQPLCLDGAWHERYPGVVSRIGMRKPRMSLLSLTVGTQGRLPRAASLLREYGLVAASSALGVNCLEDCFLELVAWEVGLTTLFICPSTLIER